LEGRRDRVTWGVAAYERLYTPARRGCKTSYKISVYQLGLADGLLPSSLCGSVQSTSTPRALD